MPEAASSSSRSRPAGPTNGLPRKILLVARLFTDEHQAGLRHPFAGHGLGCEAMERAALTGKQFSFQQICRVLVGRRGRRARRGCPLSSPGG